MRTPAFFFAFLVLLACRADDDRALPDTEFRRGAFRIGFVVPSSSPSWDSFGEPETGYWSCYWPDKLLPESVPGYLLLSPPTDRSKGNRVKAKRNWGHPVIYGWWNAQAVAVWCHIHHEGPRPHNGKVTVCPCRSVIDEPAAFHGLNASFAIPTGDAMPIVPARGVVFVPIPRPLPFKRRLYFSFRLDNLAFDLLTEARTQRDAEAALLGVAEAIYLHNRLRHSPLRRP